jgi:ubiquinone/menaquinone biosynthesis C-methylase UbiE
VASVAPGVNDRYATAEGRAATVKILEGDGRDEYQRPEEVIRNLDLKAGDVVCEIGAGSGYFTPFLATAVGPTGRVYAQDPQREFLELLEQKVERLDLKNVEVVLGTYTDTNLPDNVCNVTFLLDTYHHFEWPTPMLDAMKKDTTPEGRLVIVDWYRRQNAVFDKWGIDALQHVRLDVDGVVEEVTRHGWTHLETRTFLDDQFFAVFKAR